jgi:hypothetical protein
MGQKKKREMGKEATRKKKKKKLSGWCLVSRQQGSDG